MAKNKTQKTEINVADFIATLTDDVKKADSLTLINLIKKRIKTEPKMWGSSIIGFGEYHYVYNSGHEGDAPIVAFSPRATALTLYLSENLENREELLLKLGKHKASKGCIYIKKLGDIKVEILDEMIQRHIEQVRIYRQP